MDEQELRAALDAAHAENQTLRDQVTELMRRLMDTQPRPKQED